MQSAIPSTSQHPSPSWVGRLVRLYEERLRRELFHPTFPLGWVMNPHYIARSRLRFYIKKLAAKCHGRILDYGCGNMPYREFFTYTTYIGLEYGNPALSTETMVYTPDSTIPFPDSYFDTILCTQVLEHVSNPEKVLEEFYRVLQRGGLLLLSVPLTWPIHPHPHDFRRFTPEGIENLLQRHGFQIVTMISTTSTILTLTQLWLDFIRQKLWLWSRYSVFILLYRLLIASLLQVPFLLMGYTLDILIRDEEKLLPLDIVILARK